AFAFGPLLWAPMSEFYGRRYPLLIGFFLSPIFQIPVAVAHDVATIMICRFFAGFFGSSPFATAGGVLADIWPPVERGIAMAAFASATFVLGENSIVLTAAKGPVMGPIIGGFITESYLGWRWTEWITVIMGLTLSVIALLCVPETSPARILTLRAQRLRVETKQWELHAAAEETLLDPRALLTTYFSKPFAMLLLEPILILFTVYMSTVYGILYLFLEAFPISFQQQRGWSLGVGALPFLSLIVGVVIGAAFAVWYTRAVIAPKAKRDGGLLPEDRLVPMVVGGVLLPAGLFWFAWTSSPDIAETDLFDRIFMQGLTYIVDVYLWHANSALAANGILRAFFGAGFPLFATTMYQSLGVAWASSLLAFLTVAMVPAPLLFLRFGARIRSWSRYSPKNRPDTPPQPSERSGRSSAFQMRRLSRGESKRNSRAMSTRIRDEQSSV
ncbi:hypothetical protein LTR28_006657, partial [Elasticomyces elasticus]